jgi:pilus assembly protein CpaE
VFNALLFVVDDNACAAIEKLALESKQVSFQKTLDRFPPASELGRLLNAAAPDLVFVDLGDWNGALAAAADIRSMSPKIPIIGFGAGWDDGKEEQCMAAGITAMLVSPVSLKSFEDSVDRAIHAVSGHVQENLFAFLPAKAGSGCTTIALNTAGYMADTSRPTSLGKKVLLVESDLRSGVLSVLLGLDHPFSLADALDDSVELDYSRWTKILATCGGLDVMLANAAQPGPLPSWTQYHRLLSFAAHRYDSILVDLPEVINSATVEIARQAERVFVVCTPELPSLALTPRRCEELVERGIPAEKIQIILNRWHKGEITAAQVEKLVKHPVAVTIGNDYRTVSQAAREHQFVGPYTKIGQSFAAFSKQLVKAPDSPGGGTMLGFLKGLGTKSVLQPGA